MSKDSSIKSNFLLDFIVAGMSAGISKTAIAPIERVKLLLQNQAIMTSLDKNYIGLSDCFKRVYREEGLYSFWRGNSMNVFRYIPMQAFSFALKDTFKAWFRYPNPENKFSIRLLSNFMIGGTSACASLVLIQPMDFLRTKLSTDIKSKAGVREFSGVTDCARKVYAKEGIFGFYRGMIITVCGLFPYRAIYFGGYDTLKETILKGRDSAMNKFLAATTCTIGASFSMYWMDTVRRRILIQSGKDNKDYTGTIDCIRKMYKKEGIKGFYKGFGANAIRSLGSSLVLILYDEIQGLFGITPRHDT